MKSISYNKNMIFALFLFFSFLLYDILFHILKVYHMTIKGFKINLIKNDILSFLVT